MALGAGENSLEYVANLDEAGFAGTLALKGDPINKSNDILKATLEDAVKKAVLLLRNSNIELKGVRLHLKASEAYVDVVFAYPGEGESWSGAVPLIYRRTATDARVPEDITKAVTYAYESMRPQARVKWIEDQEEFWRESKANVTRPIFEAMLDSKWKCVACGLPSNPNWARRIQDIKECGYTVATDTNRMCPTCKKASTHVVLLRIPRGGGTGYEVISSSFRERAISVLGGLDAFEGRRGRFLLPDHKFPEVRWDEDTRKENPDTMSDEEIRAKFQLLTNQRNLQKREVCRECFQTNVRPSPHSIKFFYEGTELWPKSIPIRGPGAEKGCVGCGWYDCARWREELNKKLAQQN